MKVNIIYKDKIIKETTVDHITSEKYSMKKGARWEVNGLDLQVVNMEINHPANYMDLNFEDYDKVIDIKTRFK
ncbi:hypothetical protein CSV75_01835 [Sporosarcina sp. P18a]|uniref:hypothetical protein n=1 Tax=Sporosarcina sp. P18a TaxID=2048259 RepID=UPI000C16C4E3|nr:hypothetical protein [Sporosarcina sp. P18a]PIC80557.1 hypothetical protein CSV75_01835 [Sporosarcina sp. P18a]